MDRKDKSVNVGLGSCPLCFSPTVFFVVVVPLYLSLLHESNPRLIVSGKIQDSGFPSVLICRYNQNTNHIPHAKKGHNLIYTVNNQLLINVHVKPPL